MAAPAKPKVDLGTIVIPPAASKKQLSWQEQVLQGIGVPLSSQNVAFLNAWQAQEGTSAANNPLATTMPAANATPLPGNTAGVKNYPDAATGIRATIDTLKKYKGIIAAFKTGDASKAAANYVGDFARWSGNTDNPSAALGYVNGILRNVGVPAGFLASTPGASSTEAKVTAEGAATALKATRNNPWVTASGKLVYGATAPDDVLPSQSFFGQGMLLSEFNQAAAQKANLYRSYTGKEPTVKDLAPYMSGANGKPITYNGMMADLAARPSFMSSPTWKSEAPKYALATHDVMGQNAKPDLALVKQAIVNGWDADVFKDKLRSMPSYEKSDEFQKQAAGLSAQYQQIYGTPDENAQQVVHAAVKNGWDPTQFAQYLRAQPAYTQSNEYQQKAISLMSALGLVTGGTPVLRPGVGAANPQAGSQPALASDQGAQGATGFPQAPVAAVAPSNELVPSLVGSGRIGM